MNELKNEIIRVNSKTDPQLYRIINDGFNKMLEITGVLRGG